MIYTPARRTLLWVLNTAPEELIPLLRIMNPDFVQTDCKGHPGYVSWFSETQEASVPPGLKHDALRGWREATQEMGGAALPLFRIWDIAAGARHSEWAVTQAPSKLEMDQQRGGQNTATSDTVRQKMCPRSDYLDRLMIRSSSNLSTGMRLTASGSMEICGLFSHATAQIALLRGVKKGTKASRPQTRRSLAGLSGSILPSGPLWPM